MSTEIQSTGTVIGKTDTAQLSTVRTDSAIPVVKIRSNPIQTRLISLLNWLSSQNEKNKEYKVLFINQAALKAIDKGLLPNQKSIFSLKSGKELTKIDQGDMPVAILSGDGTNTFITNVYNFFKSTESSQAFQFATNTCVSEQSIELKTSPNITLAVSNKNTPGKLQLQLKLGNQSEETTIDLDAIKAIHQPL